MDDEYILLGENGRELGGYLRMITDGLQLGVGRAAEGSTSRMKAATHILAILPGTQLTLGFNLVDRMCSLTVSEYVHPNQNLIDYWENLFSKREGLTDYPWDELRNFYLIRNRFIHTLGQLDDRKQSQEIIDFSERLNRGEITYSTNARNRKPAAVDPYYSIEDSFIVLGNWTGRFRSLIRDLYEPLYDSYANEDMARK